MAEFLENNIEWLTGDDTVTVSFSQKKYVNKIKKYAENYQEIDIVAENEDGSICAHIPLTWLKISPKRKGREFSEEERIIAIEKLKKAREKKNQNLNK